MDFVKLEEPNVRKPIMIAAMQDMGNVGSIAIDFINKSLNTRLFRYLSPPYPNYVVDKGGHIDFQQERWEYRYAKDIIVFGGGIGQPQTNHELYELCDDVIDIAKSYSVQLIYTLGAFHTDRNYGKNPRTLVTTTSRELTDQIVKIGHNVTPGSSLITGFNGLILGYAKKNNIQGIGLYAEIDDPQIAQYRSAKSLLLSLEKLTYHKFNGMGDLDEIACAIERELDRMKRMGGDALYRS
ncbi:MAG: PAC2 family protein [Thermoproteota archaeon]|jgi:proteasome assembly chaperone (PAC2) family protein|nr:PAC2 family protein [Thermoproteota archaeon]